MELLYPLGYSGKLVNEQQFVASTMWRGIDPEFGRRLLALMRALGEQGVRYGVGEALRLASTQERLFLERHVVVSSGGCCGWQGKRYQLKAGVAHAAPPGASYHEDCTPDGKCLAVDMIGDHVKAELLLSKFGLLNFRQVNGEPWHLQCSDLPTRRRLFDASSMWPLRSWPLGSEVLERVVPTPTLRVGSKGEDVRWLQELCNSNGWRGPWRQRLAVDGDFGSRTAHAVRAMQTQLKVHVDGVYGPRTAGALADFVA